MGRVAPLHIDARKPTLGVSVKERVKSFEHGYDHYDVAVQKLNNVNHLSAGSITNNVVFYTTKALEVNDLVVRTALNSMKAVEEFFKESRFVAEAVECLRPILQIVRTIGVALIPLYTYQLGKGVYDFAKHKIDLGDFLLHTFQSLALLTDSIVAFLQDLVTFGQLPLGLLKYLWPFDLIGLVLSTVSLISHARGWHNSANFVKEFDKLMDFKKDASQLTNEDIDAVVDFIMKQDKKRVEKIFEISQDSLVQKIEKVANRAKFHNKDTVPANERMIAQEEFTSAMKTLRGRVKSKITSHQLGVTSSSISLVANSILFVSPFLIPVCPVITAIMPGLYAMKGVGGSISFSNFLYSTITKYQFNHSDLMKEKTQSTNWGDVELEDLVKNTEKTE